jgi:hypothetical protein
MTITDPEHRNAVKHDLAEGATEFAEKRAPEWQGR